MAEGTEPTPVVGATSARLGTHRSSSSASPAKDLYADVTARVVEMLDQGVVPWRSPILGRGAAGHPRNLSSGKRYRGINIFLLAFTAFARNYESCYWLTYQQAVQRGGHVKKGERSSVVVFWKRFEPKDQQLDENGKPLKRPGFLLRHYNVFNAAQCEGIEVPDAPKFMPSEFKPVERAEQIVNGYPDGPKVIHGGSQTFYRAKDDEVHLPHPTRFTSTDEYYSARFHELSHSTGHSKRLDRKLDTDPKPFGTPDYGREELVAEMAAAFLSAEAGISPAVILNQAAYISGWLGVLKADKKLVVTAAGAAQKAADWILNVKPDAQADDRVATDAAHG
ncbi:MAG: zincin-like metallopeptidase domain-containing protein [Tepidisphaeraceae bacterium]